MKDYIKLLEIEKYRVLWYYGIGWYILYSFFGGLGLVITWAFLVIF